MWHRPYRRVWVSFPLIKAQSISSLLLCISDIALLQEEKRIEGHPVTLSFMLGERTDGAWISSGPLLVVA